MADIDPYPTNSAWPAEFQGCRLTGRYLDTLGFPVVGSVTFRPSPAALLAFTSRAIIIAATRTVQLDTNGAFDVYLPATNDPDINPVDWTYSVTEVFPGGRSFSIAAPMNLEIDLVNEAPIPASMGTPIVRGPAGMEVVEHGTDANAPRPAGVPLVYWVGPVRPVNSLPIDFWYNG